MSSVSCDLGAFTIEENKRHRILLNKALAAIKEVKEIENGFKFSFSSENFLTIAEWISLEKRCCNFLSFQIGISGNDELFSLTISGPNGTKNMFKSVLQLASNELG
jgi:hypothetical protein